MLHDGLTRERRHKYRVVLRVEAFRQLHSATDFGPHDRSVSAEAQLAASVVELPAGLRRLEPLSEASSHRLGRICGGRVRSEREIAPVINQSINVYCIKMEIK